MLTRDKESTLEIAEDEKQKALTGGMVIGLDRALLQVVLRCRSKREGDWQGETTLGLIEKVLVLERLRLLRWRRVISFTAVRMKNDIVAKKRDTYILREQNLYAPYPRHVRFIRSSTAIGP